MIMLHRGSIQTIFSYCVLRSSKMYWAAGQKLNFSYYDMETPFFTVYFYGN